MRHVIVKSWPELAPIWPGIFEADKFATPYQSYEFLTLTGKGKPQRKDLFRLIGIKELNLVLYKNGEAIAIAPLLIKKKNKRNVVFFRGQFTAACNLDFVYKTDWSYDDFAFLLDSVHEMLGDVAFRFDRVAEKSATYRYMKEYFAPYRPDPYECASIPVPACYEDWFGGLRKPYRRNITRYLNRFDRENITWRAGFYQGNTVDDRTYKQMMAVYAGRFLVKNGFHFGPLKPLVLKVLQRMLLKDKVSRFLRESDKSFHGVLYLNGRVAAFNSGLLYKDKRICFCRLAIDTEFASYCPGGLLINATMKHIVENNQNGRLNVDQMDLSVGTDGGMAYKFHYGGVGYYRYNFVR